MMNILELYMCLIPSEKASSLERENHKSMTIHGNISPTSYHRCDSSSCKICHLKGEQSSSSENIAGYRSMYINMFPAIKINCDELQAV